MKLTTQATAAATGERAAKVLIPEEPFVDSLDRLVRRAVDLGVPRGAIVLALCAQVAQLEPAPRNVMFSRRRTRIVEMLARGARTVPELATSLGCSQRTVFRELRAIRRSGLPIRGSAGRGGGVTL